MKMISRVGIGVAAAATAITVAASPASAAPDTSGRVTSPSKNIIVFQITGLKERSFQCSAYINGPTTYTTPGFRVPPKGTTKITIGDVPAGYYRAQWQCGSFHQGYRSVTVAGSPTGKPRIVKNRPASRAPEPGFGGSSIGSITGSLEGGIGGLLSGLLRIF